MDASERQRYILNKLNQNGSVKISGVATDLETSRETIRKDIYTLGRQHLLKVIRGGAEPITREIKESSFLVRKNKNVKEKVEIANLALQLIKPGSSIYLDFGSTTVALAQAIAANPVNDLTVVTNSLNIINTLKDQAGIELILLGGIYRPGESSLSGPLALNNIHDIYCDLGFFGCGGIDLDAGITNHYFNEVSVSKHMFRHCQKRIVIADHTKFNRKALYQTSKLNNIDIIITDKIKEKQDLAAYKEDGIKLIHC